MQEVLPPSSTSSIRITNRLPPLPNAPQRVKNGSNINQFSYCRHRGRCISKLAVMIVAMMYFTILIYILGLATKHLASNDDDIRVFKVDSVNDESFSACLLIMDDNHRLSEWIGFHYFAMSLRYLVVAVDPHSKTSPSQILNRWRDRITVVEWTDSNFTDKSLIIGDTDDHQMKRDKHITRQVDFYLECTRHLQSHNRTWTSYHDVDEFISINADVVSHAQELFRQPGSILRIVKRYSDPTNSIQNATIKENVESHNNTETMTKEPEYWFKHFQQSCCITLPRALYGAVESTDEEVAQGVPSIFVKNAKQFDTLRWRYRTTSPRGMSDGLAKSIIDVSKLRPEDYKGGAAVHKALKSVCPHTWLKYDFPLGFHHYLGSWEQYSFREDARKAGHRTLEKWKSKSLQKGGGSDDEVRGWIAGFVKLVGKVAAFNLLRDIGLPPNYTKSDNETALWAKERE